MLAFFQNFNSSDSADVLFVTFNLTCNDYVAAYVCSSPLLNETFVVPWWVGGGKTNRQGRRRGRGGEDEEAGWE